jgi:uncharacterized protein
MQLGGRDADCPSDLVKLMKELEVARELPLPLNAVTQKMAWLGRTGSGKTYGCKRFVERMLLAGAQVLILDTMGMWPGLRRGPKAFNIPVFGGLYGDIPLEPGSGALIADVAVDFETSMVCDVSQFLDSERSRWATAFMGRLFQRKKSAPSALHVVLDECQDFVPQNPQHGEEKMLHEFHRSAKQGRALGIGMSFVTQRPQEVNKKALNQVECVFAFQMTGPHERKALEYWLSDKGLGTGDKLGDILPRLEVGAPHVWSPQWLKISKVVHILPIDSQDTSQTPKVGDRKSSVKPLNLLDSGKLQEIREQMADTIERAKQEDPVRLRTQISKLTKDLQDSRTQYAKLEVAAKKLEARPATQVDLSELNTYTLTLETAVQGIQEAVKALKVVQSANDVPRALPPTPSVRLPAKSLPLSERHLESDNGKLEACPRALLNVLAARHPRITTAAQLAVMSGYSVRSSTFSNGVSKLRVARLLEGSRGSLHITLQGQHEAGKVEPYPSGEDLLDYWSAKLEKCPRELLRVIYEHGQKRSLTREFIADNAVNGDGHYSAGSSTFSNGLSRLRVLELIKGTGDSIQLSDTFFE